MRSDRRTRYTQTAIKNAFIDALSTKPINKITVRDICDAADVNRGTFYLHYQDVYALLEALEQEYAEKIIDLLQQPHNIFAGEFTDFFIKFMEYLEENPQAELVLHHPASSGKGLQRVIDFSYHQHTSAFTQYGEVSKVELDILLNYMWHGSVHAIREWREKGICEKEEFVSILSKIIEQGMNGFWKI